MTEYMTEEYIDILDEGGEKTGESFLYTEVHKKGLLHLAVHVWVVNNKNEILLQKRTQNRLFNPGLWDISASGHVSSGETSVVAAVRETKEELGIDISEKDLKLICRLEEGFTTPGYINKEFDDVYVVKKDIDITDINTDNDEFDQVVFLSLNEFNDWVTNKRDIMVPHEEYKVLIDYLSR